MDLGFAEVGVVKGKVVEVNPRIGQVESVSRSQRPNVPKVRPTETEVTEQVRSAVAAEQAEKVAKAATAEPLEEPDEESILEPKEPKTRVGLPKKTTRRKEPLTNYEYMTTLKGFDPYTFEGV